MIIDGLRVYHLTATLDRSDVSLCHFDVAQWLWPQLRAAFPAALACCLMPDHPHLLTLARELDEARRALNRVLGALARKLGVRHIGEASPPSLVPNRQKLARDLRYVALNPPRAALVQDPLAWVFSTHRDIVGATVDPWVDARRIARALGRPLAGFVAAYHHYVSADPSVDVAGTALPRPAAPTDIARFPLARIARAAAAATRTRPEQIRDVGLMRELFVHLAREQGWRDLETLARACACSTRTIRRIEARPVDLDAARLCLGDGRLLRGVPRWGAPPQPALSRAG
jgi:hypothetical protein